MPHVDLMDDREYLTPAMLGNKDVTVTIARVKRQPVRNPETSRDEDKWVIYFEGRDKGLVTGSTIRHDIARVTGEKQSENWIGKPITLFATETKVRGNWEPCIRIRGGKGWKGDRQ